MTRSFKPISHDDQLSLVGHLDELRFRLLVSLAAFGTALALCFWKNHLLLSLVNAPLAGRRPVTLGVTEPFTSTLTVACYGAFALALPVLLYQFYAFLLPAFSPSERRVARPLLLMIPVLFIVGACFGYFVVLPTALKFLLHFNASQFDLQLRARDYYGFFAKMTIACGLLFQVPVGVLVATRLGITTPEKLRHHRRYAILVCAVVAAALPGVDPISMVLEMVPLVVLYEASILLAAALGRAQPVSPESS